MLMNNTKKLFGYELSIWRNVGLKKIISNPSNFLNLFLLVIFK